MKTHKQQLLEHLRTKITKRLNTKAGIHQVVNEMALTPEGLRDVQKIGDDLMTGVRSDSFDQEHPIRKHLSKYHELLRTHPTMIFDGKGNHIGNIRHEDLNGQPMAGPSKDEVESHDDSLHYYAYTADQAIRRHEAETGRRIGGDPYPNPYHVRRGPDAHGPANTRLRRLYPGPIT